MKKKEIYYFNKKEMPTVPVPGDCIVKKIEIEEDSLNFVFDEDIAYHDAIKEICPDAKSLIIKFHLKDDISDIGLYIKDMQNHSIYNVIDVAENSDALLELSKSELSYLHHNVGYCSIIIKLWSKRNIVLDLSVDYVEFEWS